MTEVNNRNRFFEKPESGSFAIDWKQSLLKPYRKFAENS